MHVFWFLGFLGELNDRIVKKNHKLYGVFSFITLSKIFTSVSNFIRKSMYNLSFKTSYKRNKIGV